MERFGIFELLDALSALPRAEEKDEREAGEEAPAKERVPPPADPAPTALESFLKRHDALAKKAERK